MFSSSKFFKEAVIRFFISSMNFALCSKEQLNFYNPLPLDRITLFVRETRIGIWSEEKGARMSVCLTDSCKIFEIKK